jgi:hypothetical protein
MEKLSDETEPDDEPVDVSKFDLDAALAALDLVDALTARAIEIVDGSSDPRLAYVGEKELAKLDIDGDEATLSWPESHYDESPIETKVQRFPAFLLFLDEAALADWKARQLELQEAEWRKRAQDQATQNRAEAEARDRAEWARLKAKFEGQ